MPKARKPKGGAQDCDAAGGSFADAIPGIGPILGMFGLGAGEGGEDDIAAQRRAVGQVGAGRKRRAKKGGSALSSIPVVGPILGMFGLGEGESAGAGGPARGPNGWIKDPVSDLLVNTEGQGIAQGARQAPSTVTAPRARRSYGPYGPGTGYYYGVRIPAPTPSTYRKLESMTQQEEALHDTYVRRRRALEINGLRRPQSRTAVSQLQESVAATRAGAGPGALRGAGLWDDITDGIGKVASVAEPVMKIASMFGLGAPDDSDSGSDTEKGRGLTGGGEMMPSGGSMAGGAPSGGALRTRRTLSNRMAARNAIVARIRRERGLSLIEASRAVKAEGLWH